MSHRSSRTKMLIVAGATAVSLAIAGPATALLAGSDVASHQHPGSLAINWARVKPPATTSPSSKPPKASATSTRTTGRLRLHAGGRLIRGTYHYALPQYSAVLQAQHYAAVLATNTTDLDLPPVLDLEETGGLGPVALQAWVRTFLATLDTLTGRQTIIYVSPGFWRYRNGQHHRVFRTSPLDRRLQRWQQSHPPPPRRLDQLDLLAIHRQRLG
ncbi:MAG: glycoside hydrolase family 25 protein [Lawsonella clevelandensis]